MGTKLLAAATPIVTKFEDWPTIDRELWMRATTWDPDSFRRPHAAKLAAVSLRNAARGWGRLLAVLAEHDRLDPNIPPADRLDREAADLFLIELRATGNTNNTIRARFWELVCAIRIMQPDADTGWLTRPGEWSLHELLPASPKPRGLIGIQALYTWAVKLMEASQAHASAQRRCQMLRDGLIVAILASRAPRLRSLAAIRIGRQLKLGPDNDDCWLSFDAADIKTRRRLEYPLPPELAPWLRRYLAVERQELLAGAHHDALWVVPGGRSMQASAIMAMMRRRSRTAFGEAFGSHRFRHELATALAYDAPDNPGLSAAVLGISPAVAERAYTQPRNDLAARRINQSVADDRERTRLLATRLFGQGGV